MRNIMQTTQVAGKSFKTPGETPSVPAAFSLFRSFNCSFTSSTIIGSSNIGTCVSELMFSKDIVSSE